MDILVIGNGFDLAHGLPTKYTDFLEWEKKFQDFYLYATRRRTASYKEADSSILQYFNNLFYDENNRDICDEIYNLTHENVWIEYFLENPLYQKENWIDFESEISTVIQSIEKSMGTDNFYEPVFVLENKFFNNKYTNNIPEYYNAIYKEEQEKIRKSTITYEGLRDKLLLDLKKLSRVLEIYLTDYVEQLDCKLLSPDIQRLLPKECMRVSGMPIYNVFVLSFNYTNTYQKLF
ncbi:MAG: hypothetical protein HFG28_09470 [Eubacterium sp.]|nr:hypothetical protein [Eubacterium sp.]